MARCKNTPRSQSSKRQGKLARYVSAGLKPISVVVADPEQNGKQKRRSRIRAEGPLHSAPPQLREVLAALAPPLGKTALMISETAPPPERSWLDCHWLGRRPVLQGAPWIDEEDLSDLMYGALKSLTSLRPDLRISSGAQDALLAGAAHFELAWRHAAVLKARIMVLSQGVGLQTDNNINESDD